MATKAKVICFPFYLSHVSVRNLGMASIYGDELLKQALQNDTVVILRAQALQGIHPNVIRVLESSNFSSFDSDTTPPSSPILRFEPQAQACAPEKLAMLVASLRSARRDLSSSELCSLIEDASSHFEGHENLRTRRIDEERIWAKIWEYYY